MRLIPHTRKSDVPALFHPEALNLFEDFFGDWPFNHSLSRRERSWAPAVDILEKDGQLLIRAELPGMNEKDIEIKLEGKVLTLKGERKSDVEENRQSYHRVERVYGSFSRSFTLPDTVETDKIKAEFKTGLLTISLPQKPEIKPREIPVSVS